MAPVPEQLKASHTLTEIPCQATSSFPLTRLHSKSASQYREEVGIALVARTTGVLWQL